MSRDIRFGGNNPKGEMMFNTLEISDDQDGSAERFIINTDKRGSSPRSRPDGDIQDPDERIDYRCDYDKGVLRRNNQPMALEIQENQDGSLPFELKRSGERGLMKIVLTLGPEEEAICFSTAVYLRNRL